MPKKGVSKKPIGITIDIGLLKRLDHFCEKNFSKRSGVMEGALRKFLEENRK